ncbi:Microcystin-dependent protein [Epilithonimonas lactis]|uniref:Phage tail collar domain-containing protein n=1 Tax=Epilithonimonas lactis TaxID=421072 RepID=A0A085B966_9FLAO|nr:hypothetical protein IO89_15945 [Epilithonimonas lactis]SEQ95359.1 Microcystin-dependent protein [Epilithonimonas lactis]
MRTIKLLTLTLILTISSKLAAQADTPYVGQILWVPYNFTPSGWAECNGALLPISGNEVLYSLLGTQYGGNGMQTFGLPDLRGRAIIGSGAGTGLTPRFNGEMIGTPTVTLTSSQIPQHTHNINTVTTPGNQNLPIGNLPANTGSADPEYSNQTPDVTLNAQMIQPAGQNLPHNNMQPYTTLKCIISLYGVYPSRP